MNNKKTVSMKTFNIKLWKYSGIFLWATGILHTVVAVVLGMKPMQAILNDGLFNAVGSDVEHSFVFWFLIAGLVLIAFGHTLHHYIKREQKPAPLFAGYYLLALAVICCIVVPVSGGWLFLPQALIIIFAKREEKQL
jgi:hypothetical protein